MKTSTIDKVVWPTIYVGLVIGAFGFSLRDDSTAIAWSLIGVAAALIVCGGVLIGVRSKRRDP